ncbi:MAG: biopolymer transporter ExbD [Gemmataceae bacterium]
MSHGPTSNSELAEPNLIPLLDLVLQLVMFFMMCANFAMQENDQSIKLPTSQQAKPVADTGPDVLHLGIDQDGAVRVVGRPPLTTDEEIVTFLRLDVYEANKRRAAERGESEVRTLVIVRADRNTAYEKVYRVMRQCQQAGLRKLQLRADRGGGSS